MLLTIVLCAALIGVDQLLKLWAVQSLAPTGSAPLIPGILKLQYIENDGMAFSMLSGYQTLLIIVTGIVLLGVVCILLFRRPKGRLEYIAFVLIFSGGAGNWIDRFLNGYVVDYIATIFINFAVFNFADILLTTGFALLVVAILRAEIMDKKRKTAENAADTKSPGTPPEDPAALPGPGAENRDGDD